jgi:hypothetical protein
MDRHEQNTGESDLPSDDGVDENPYTSPRIAERPVHKRISIVATIGIVLATMAASITAFCCACTVGAMAVSGLGLIRFGLVVPMIIGVIAAVLIGSSVRRRMWQSAQEKLR